MKVYRIGGLILLGALVAAAIAADTSAPGLGDFKTLPARSAAETYTGTLTRLTRDYKEKGDVARKTCIAQLGVAQQAATKAGNLDEALRIRDAITKLNAETAENTKSNGPTGLILERQRLTAALAGTLWQSGDAKLKFADDGTGTYANADKPAWEWVAMNGKEIYIRFGSGFTDRLEFDDAVKTFTFLEIGGGKLMADKAGKRLQ
jgi:hypothetical protein